MGSFCKDLQRGEYTYFGRAIIRGSLCLLFLMTPASRNWLLKCRSGFLELFSFFVLLMWGYKSHRPDIELLPQKEDLQNAAGGGKLVAMKRWHLIAIAILVAGMGAAWYFDAGSLLRRYREQFAPRSGAVDSDAGNTPAASTDWQTVERPDEGFRVDLPSDPKDLQVPAYNESGGSEPIKMLVATTDGETTYAVSWEDNPPVARVNNRLPERTLEMARDGMLARTRASLVGDDKLIFKGYPTRDITARNSSGGMLSARLIFAGERLYTLMALFPSDRARREKDVKHFFNSFQPAGSSRVSETVPAAANSGE